MLMQSGKEGVEMEVLLFKKKSQQIQRKMEKQGCPGEEETFSITG